MLAFRDAVKTSHATELVHLLFNNAGIAGGGSFAPDDRAEWDKTFAVCWCGVYYCTRAFLPLLVAAPDAHLVNTSSVNGFWASVGPSIPHTAYSAAKFAVKGFSEALITDLRVNAPHVKVVRRDAGPRRDLDRRSTAGVVLGRPSPKEMTGEDLQRVRERLARAGPARRTARATTSCARVSSRWRSPSATTRPSRPPEAATQILDGVREERWRILVGDDAKALDRLVRETPRGGLRAGLHRAAPRAGLLRRPAPRRGGRAEGLIARARPQSAASTSWGVTKIIRSSTRRRVRLLPPRK